MFESVNIWIPTPMDTEKHGLKFDDVHERNLCGPLWRDIRVRSRAGKQAGTFALIQSVFFRAHSWLNFSFFFLPR